MKNMFLNKTIRRGFSLLLTAVMLASAAAGLGGCKAGSKLPEISLSVWSDERNQELLEGMIAEFEEKYKDEATFSITVSDESELTCKETVLMNPEAAADVYIFADDQFEELWRAGALLEITENTDAVIEANGGAEGGAIRSAMRDGKLYAYPETAGNGYFLYYNKEYFSEEDVKSFDRILDVAAQNGKKVAMDFSSGWYIYSFFKGAGLELECNEDGVTNRCNWNANDTKYKGVDVAQAMLDISMHDGFVSCVDDDFMIGVKNGSIIAGINGAWNAADIQKAYGENYAAVKLPEYTLAGDSVQMCSFAGYKLVGVNAYSKNPHWAMMLAEWITNEENQIKRFEAVGECPSNVNAAADEKVQTSPAVAALTAQSKYGYTQSVADQFWDPACVFGTTIAAKNIDGKDLQTLLDNLVEKVTAVSVKKAE